MYMETDDENDDDDDDGADDAHGMLELDRSLPGKNKVNCVSERSAEKKFGTERTCSNKIMVTIIRNFNNWHF